MRGLLLLFSLLCGRSRVLAAVIPPGEGRGMLLCVGSRMVKDAEAVIFQTREVWNSSMGISVAHCNELGASVVASFAAKNVSAINLCGLDFPVELERRLRGWFCKAAALIKSPYKETLVADLDTVWFKSPEVIFDSPAFKSTGSLFFRDKTSVYKAVKKTENEKTFQDQLEEFIVAASKGAINITSELGKKKQFSDGHSFFWRNVANRNAPTLNNYQDSSVIALDKSRHPKMLKILEEIIPYFKLGYGDKEIYWMAATAADEPFSFEPYLCSLYGDCGLLLHMDPGILDPNKTSPLYLNGEWLLEKIHILGHDLEFDYIKPVLVHENLTIHDVGETRGCLCRVYGCNKIPDTMNTLLVQAQWERLSRNMGRQGPQSDCLPIYKPTAGIISGVAEKWVSEGRCPQFGCTDAPLFVNETLNWFSDSFCDPVYFTPSAPSDLKLMEKRAQLPPPPPQLKEGELVRPGSSKVVYIVRNGTLHAIPDLHTFYTLGRDFSEVVVLPDYQMHQVTIADSLTPS